MSIKNNHDSYRDLKGVSLRLDGPRLRLLVLNLGFDVQSCAAIWGVLGFKGLGFRCYLFLNCLSPEAAGAAAGKASEVQGFRVWGLGALVH